MIRRYETFTFIISDITRNIRKIKAEETAKWNLKSQHVSCIYYLYERGPLTSKEMCDICGDDKANVSRSIEYLLKNGYIERTESEGKLYKKHFALTSKGREIGQTVFERIESILERASMGISDGDSKAMYSTLGSINDNLKKVIEEYRD